MLRSDELRIGNWIRYKVDIGSFRNCKVQGIVENEFHCEAENVFFQQSLNSVEAIPLTPAVLEMMGFKRTVYEEHDAYRLDLFVSVGRSLSAVSFTKSEVKGVTLFNNATPVGEMVYEYLHQFQNLFFTLTGEELQVDFCKVPSYQ